MRRQAMLCDIGRDVGRTPAGQWVDLDVAVVGLEHRQVETRRRLEALATTDPGIVARQCTLQWRHLAEGAAAIGIPGGAAEVGIEPGYLLRRGPNAAHAPEAEMGSQSIAIVERLGEMPAGVDEQDGRRGIDGGDEMQQYRRFRTER